MIKLKSLLFENKILIPRRSKEERERTLIAEHYRIIQKYIREGCQGDLNLRQSPIKILPDNLTHVGGDLILPYSKIEDLNNLENINGELDLYDSRNFKSLGKLKNVNFGVDLRHTNIETLGNLETIGLGLNISGCSNLKSLNNKLKKIGGTFDADNTFNLKNLGELEYVEGVAFLQNTLQLESLGKLKHVARLYLYNSNIFNNMSLEQIIKQINLDFRDIKLYKFP